MHYYLHCGSCDLEAQGLQHHDLSGLQAWVSDTHVLVGTKCNKLICVDATTLHMHDVTLPPKPARPQGVSAFNNSGSGCGIHAMAVSPDGSMLAVGGSDPSDCQIMQIQHQHGKGPVFRPMQTLVVCLTTLSCAFYSFISSSSVKQVDHFT